MSVFGFFVVVRMMSMHFALIVIIASRVGLILKHLFVRTVHLAYIVLTLIGSNASIVKAAVTFAYASCSSS
jgi:hypothetical protein